MKLGWCGPIENAAIIAKAGLDFIEVPLAPFGLEDQTSLAAAKRAMAACPLPTSAFNMFMPRDMRVVGADIDIRRVKSYLGRAAELLACAQSKIVVFGSGRARNVPDGFDREKAEAQFIDSLLWSADALKGSDTTLVIEPLNRKESNIVNSVGEGVRFAKAVNRPEIRVLADIYHMDEENEPLSEVATHVEWLSHIHLADTGRFNPGTGSYDYDSFFGYLKAANYRGMLSVECTVKNPEVDMRLSLGFLRQHWPSIALTCRSNRIQQQRKRMKRVLAKVEANRKEDPSSEPGSDPNTWLIEARLEEDIPDWESAQLHFASPGVEAEIIEVTISEPTRFTVRTRGESPLKKGDVIHVDVR